MWCAGKVSNWRDALASINLNVTSIMGSGAGPASVVGDPSRLMDLMSFVKAVASGIGPQGLALRRYLGELGFPPRVILFCPSNQDMQKMWEEAQEGTDPL